MENKIIYFFAKFGDLNGKPYGGGEVGNRRTLEMLQKCGYDVHLIPRYCNYKRKSLWVYLQMIIGDLLSVLLLFCTLLFKKRRNSVVHVSGFTGLYMPLEYLAVFLASLEGYKVTYEIRGGGIIDNYDKGSRIYKFLFGKTIQIADNIWSQGEENKSLIEKLKADHFFYYPNCVKPDFMPSKCPKKEGLGVNIVYLGRICPMKNVFTMLQTVLLLKNTYPDVRFDVIGDGKDFPEYEQKCLSFVKDNNLSQNCIFHGKLNANEMKPILEKSVFFLFPSEEPREGQSNSLTEIMSFGIIPIASSQGYTRRIVDSDELIENNLSASAYADIVRTLYNKDDVNRLSAKMYIRIAQSFTYNSVLESVRLEYSNIFQNL